MTTREEQIRWALKNAAEGEDRNAVARKYLGNGGEDAQIVQRLHSFTADSAPRRTKRVNIAMTH
mgnify:CR=1